MAHRIRLIVLPRSDLDVVGFGVTWAAPVDEVEAPCVPAWLETGDGETLDLGLLCAPTAATWRSQRVASLASHRYGEAGPFAARLSWAEETVEISVQPDRLPVPIEPLRPEVALFAVKMPSHQPFQRTVSVKITGLASDQQVRLDGGAGQAYLLSGRAGAELAGGWMLNYPKSGGYTVALDLLDAEGFWLATLAETPIEVSAPRPSAVDEGRTTDDEALSSFVLRPSSAADLSTALGETRPWLPYRYCRPTGWTLVRLYSGPGGGEITRVVGAGTYLSIRAETAVGGASWYLTAGGDWVAAQDVTLFVPSELRGVELGEPAPPPLPPPPDPPADRQATVTADVLNVRARPGTQPGNSPVDRLYNGATVGIYEETTVAGEVWYRIGVDRWVHSGFVRLVSTPLPPTPPPPAPPPTPPPPPTTERSGVVAADVLNVRGQPGVRPDNPPVDRLPNGATVTIYEETAYAGEAWYRVGANRWVYGAYVMLIAAPPAPPPPVPTPPPAAERRGVVTADVLNVRGQPGVSAGNPPIGQLSAGMEVAIYEETQAGGATWYRIGDGRWTHGGWIRLIEAPSRRIATGRSLAATAPDAISLPVGWVVASSLNVRARPGVADDNPPLDQVFHNQALPILESRSVGGATWYRIGAGRWIEGSSVGVARLKPRPASIGPDERWVGVCLAEQTAVCYEGDRPMYAVLAATGLPGTPTVQGIFRTWRRLDTGLMAGPGYYIEDVVWTCYFYSGYALHIAYWHDAFGRPRSHGCVNLSPYDAWWIYQWSAAGGPNSPAVYVYWA